MHGSKWWRSDQYLVQTDHRIQKKPFSHGNRCVAANQLFHHWLYFVGYFIQVQPPGICKVTAFYDRIFMLQQYVKFVDIDTGLYIIMVPSRKVSSFKQDKVHTRVINDSGSGKPDKFFFSGITEQDVGWHCIIRSSSTVISLGTSRSQLPSKGVVREASKVHTFP